MQSMSVSSRCGDPPLLAACRDVVVKETVPALTSHLLDSDSRSNQNNNMISILKLPNVPEGESAVRALLQMPVIIKMGQATQAKSTTTTTTKILASLPPKLDVIREDPEMAAIRKALTETPPALKEDSLSQLTQRVLPPFLVCMPMSPCLKVSVPPGGFKCQDCGDRFSLESSLKLHLERRSVHIRLRCSGCGDDTLSFYNRCAYLMHVRNHRESKEVITINRVHVSPLSQEDLLKSNINYSSSNSLKLINPPNGSHSLVSLAKDLLESQNNSIGNKKGVSMSGKFRCPECSQAFDSAVSREHHFGLNLTVPVLLGRCNKCEVVCASQCSLQSHQRMHLRIYPYICPECGQRCLDSWEEFMSHVHHRCFHFARRVSYKCTVCNTFYSSRQALKAHFFTAHAEQYLKCASCPMAFKTRKSFEAHKKGSHAKLDVHCTRISKCAMCEKVFLEHNPLLEHLSNHFQEQNHNARFVYACPACEMEARSKEQLASHMAIHDQESSQCVLKSDDPTSGGCVICSRVLQIKNCMGRRRHYINLGCVVCGLEIDTRKKLFVHEQDHLRNGTFICLLCHKCLFKDEEEFCAHLEQHASSLKSFPVTCSQCLFTLLNYKQALEHFRQKHLLTPKPITDSVSSNLDSQGKKKASGRRRRHRNSASSSEEHHPPIKIRIPLTLVRPEGGASTIPTTPVQDSPSKKRLRTYSGNEGTGEDFICAKCDFTCAVRTEFQQHIQVHRKDSSATQCLECGTCFVVETSLRKHLVVAHAVTDVDSYVQHWPACLLQQNNSYINSSAETLQCRICLVQFPDSMKLKSHMRSHGMAFIRSKLAANSSSPT